MTPGQTLTESVRALLTDALELYRDRRPLAAHLRHHLDRLTEPPRIALTGPWQSGKSTLVNALIGERVAPVELTHEGDGRADVVGWYRDGPAPAALAHPAGQELPVTRSSSGGLRVDGTGLPAGRVTDLVVSWPTRTLRHATLIDTPGGGDDDEDPSEADDRLWQDADLVLYLTPHCPGHPRVPDRVRQGTVASAAPVNLVLVLSRADEVGGGRVDGLLTARQLARRQYHDPRVRSACLAVVAVSGLVAFAGRTLTGPDVHTLAALAATPPTELAALLLSADRLARPDAPTAVPASARRELLDRLGIAGVRLATTLVRAGSTGRAALASELVRRAGLTELRELIARCVNDRGEVFKARSALAALETLLRAEPRPGAQRLSAGLEHILANAHDFRELRLLAALRSHGVFEGESAVEARRLVGENGTTATARLGADHRDPSELSARGHDALARWQALVADPTVTVEQRQAARVVVRSCEGVLAGLRSSPADRRR